MRSQLENKFKRTMIICNRNGETLGREGRTTGTQLGHCLQLPRQHHCLHVGQAEPPPMERVLGQPVFHSWESDMGRPIPGDAEGTLQRFFHQQTCVGGHRSRVGEVRTGMCACVFVGLKLLGISYRRLFRIFKCLLTF